MPQNIDQAGSFATEAYFLPENIEQSEPSAEPLFLSAQSMDQGESFATKAYLPLEYIEQSEPSAEAQSINEDKASATQFFLLEDIEQSEPSAEALFLSTQSMDQGESFATEAYLPLEYIMGTKQAVCH